MRENVLVREASKAKTPILKKKNISPQKILILTFESKLLSK